VCQIGAKEKVLIMCIHETNRSSSNTHTLLKEKFTYKFERCVKVQSLVSFQSQEFIDYRN
jgi:hypothetical protein